MSCDSSKFSTRLGGTHLPSFLFGVIFTKGERNLKCAHMRLKKPAASLPPRARSKIQSVVGRATMATIVGIRVLFEASHVCKKSGGVSRIHKGSQIKSPIARLSSVVSLFYSSSSSSTNPHTWLGLNGTHVSDNMGNFCNPFGRSIDL